MKTQHTTAPLQLLIGIAVYISATNTLTERAYTQDTVRVACLGDSITAGARVDPQVASYPARLQSLLGPAYTVRNFGLGGATLIKSGRPNVWQRLDDVRVFQPQIVVISVGTNDTVSGSRKNWERIEHFDEDYIDLIDQLAGLPSKPRVVLCTPTPMVLETPGLSPKRYADLTERRPRLQELSSRIQKLALANPNPKVTLVNLRQRLLHRPDLFTVKDGVHPNEKGYLAIAQVIAEHITKKKNPNIVLFLVDDMGWQDTSVPFHKERTVLNKRFRTPNMEELARSGTKFTNAYACSVCSPTRVSLMTGLNAARHRVTNWTLRKNASNDRRHPTLDFPEWNVNGISPVAGIARTVHATALPAYLSKAGYRTIHVGKAHFGAIGTPGSDPLKIGFHENIGGHAAGGPGSFLASENFSAAWRNGDRVWDVPHLEQYHGSDLFLTQALTLEANKSVDRAIAADQPFFLYMSHYAVHVPFAEDKRYYQNYRDAGLEPIEAMYAAMVQGMDHSLGEIIRNIHRQTSDRKTIVIFTSDNGGLSAQGRGGPRHTHNHPLSSGKGSAHEGGIRVPLIVSWPGVTAAESVRDEPVMIEDLFPTILQIAGVNGAEQIGGSLDGWSIVDLLENAPKKNRETRPLFWHFPNHWGPRGPGIGPSSAVRSGPWKLIYYHEQSDYELFNLTTDLSEKNDLSEQEPDVRDRLADLLGNYLASVQAQMPIKKATGLPVPYPSATASN